MTIKEACQQWINRDFSNIPTSLIIKSYKDNPYELECLNSEKFLNDRYDYGQPYDWPCIWGTCFHPDFSLDEEWIRDNVEEVEKCGLLIYESDEIGIILAVDGAGYDFYSDHWIPLYKKRGLQWHSEKEEVEQ
jgi:hypothetical protein